MPASFVDIVRWRARNQPGRLAFRFLADGEEDEFFLTYGDLDRRSRSIGAILQSSVKEGDRVLLLFPPGLDFISSFFGCLYAKVIAIPAYPPHPARLDRSLPIVRQIADDAGAAAVLLNTSLFDAINSRPAIRNAFDDMKMLVTDKEGMDIWEEQWQHPELGGDTVAYLQYTSGSTRTPRGVMISHANLLHNLDLIEKCFGVSEDDHGVIWLPPYHDMGLIAGILQPVYSGTPFTLMPHLLFLQRPIRWLQAISRFRATISGSPNFAYDLCVRKIKPEQKERLDLSSWKIAFNGAEPIYHKTLERFSDYFSSCGFRKETFVPCYGLAESTLLVTAGAKGSIPIVHHLVSNGVEQNKVIVSPVKTGDTPTLVSSGKTNVEQKVKIVDPETMKPCLPDEIGEIWVSGPSVAMGYWNKSKETGFTFGARLSDSEEGPFLRTGDLGFLHDNGLYVTGRLKNLIISEGKNHYPQDIERTVESCHPAVRMGGCAVFTIMNEGQEDVIIVAETEHKLPAIEGEILSAIREAVSINHGLHVHDIKLTKPGGIPRTTSGKIRHFLCRENYIAGSVIEIETT